MYSVGTIVAVGQVTLESEGLVHASPVRCRKRQGLSERHSLSERLRAISNNNSKTEKNR